MVAAADWRRLPSPSLPALCSLPLPLLCSASAHHPNTQTPLNPVGRGAPPNQRRCTSDFPSLASDHRNRRRWTDMPEVRRYMGYMTSIKTKTAPGRRGGVRARTTHRTHAHLPPATHTHPPARFLAVFTHGSVPAETERHTSSEHEHVLSVRTVCMYACTASGEDDL